MALEVSPRSRCLQAFYQTGFDSEDAQVQRYAKVQRVVAYLVELGVLGTAAGFAVWGYNDPNRENQASLPKFFYISAAGGGTVLVAIYAIHIKRFCQYREDKPTWIVDPLIAATVTAGAALGTMWLVKLKAQEIADAIHALNQEYQTKSEIYEKQIDACYEEVFANRALFSEPDCIVCDTPSIGRISPSFYQAKPKDWFTQVVCRPDNAYRAEQWEGMHDVLVNASVSGGKCGDVDFRDEMNYTEYRILNYMSGTLRVWPPMEIDVSDPFVNAYNQTCKEVNATGMEIWSMSSTLCLFRRSFEGDCTTPEWTNYSAHYWDNALEAPTYHYYALSDQVSNLIYTDSLNTQIYPTASALLFSLIAIFGRFLSKRVKCGAARAEPHLEMANLNAEVTDP